MAVMECRATYTLDEITIRGIKDLALQWKVSQAEVVRRAVAKAVADYQGERAHLRDRLSAYQADGLLAAETAALYLAEVNANRSDWGREE